MSEEAHPTTRRQDPLPGKHPLVSTVQGRWLSAAGLGGLLAVGAVFLLRPREAVVNAAAPETQVEAPSTIENQVTSAAQTDPVVSGGPEARKAELRLFAEKWLKNEMGNIFITIENPSFGGSTESSYSSTFRFGDHQDRMGFICGPKYPGDTRIKCTLRRVNQGFGGSPSDSRLISLSNTYLERRGATEANSIIKDARVGLSPLDPVYRGTVVFVTGQRDITFACAYVPHIQSDGNRLPSNILSDVTCEER